ncbi:hypothetical protein B0H66DRAFT_551330, partial [Apodospora peruviana]
MCLFRFPSSFFTSRVSKLGGDFSMMIWGLIISHVVRGQYLGKQFSIWSLCNNRTGVTVTQVCPPCGSNAKYQVVL